MLYGENVYQLIPAGKKLQEGFGGKQQCGRGKGGHSKQCLQVELSKLVNK